jgi:low affinity Fe/Cu permease
MAVTREIVLDEESNRILESLSEAYGGDPSEVIRELLQSCGVAESNLDAVEQTHADELRRQRDRSEQEAREGEGVPWTELKRRCGL